MGTSYRDPAVWAASVRDCATPAQPREAPAAVCLVIRAAGLAGLGTMMVVAAACLMALSHQALPRQKTPPLDACRISSVLGLGPTYGFSRLGQAEELGGDVEPGQQRQRRPTPDPELVERDPGEAFVGRRVALQDARPEHLGLGR